MSNKFVKKNIELSLEFDRYLAKHPGALAKIPHGAYVIITQKGNPTFNKQSKSLVTKVKQRYIEAIKEGSRWTLQPFVAV